jgi:hypothetical protein
MQRLLTSKMRERAMGALLGSGRSARAIGGRPEVFPQYAGAEVPRRANFAAFALLGAALAAGGYVALNGFDADAYKMPNEPTMDDIKVWWRELKFGQDEAFPAVILLPASLYFVRRYCRHGSTFAVRNVASILLCVSILQAWAPTFLQNLVPPLKRFEAPTLAEQTFKRPLLLEYFHEERSFMLQARKASPYTFQNATAALDSDEPTDSTPFRGGAQSIVRGAHLVYDGLAAFFSFPAAVFGYFWVENGEQLYEDEYRAFVHFVNRRRDKRLSSPDDNATADES